MVDYFINLINNGDRNYRNRGQGNGPTVKYLQKLHNLSELLEF
jgi:hypothetical protein